MSESNVPNPFESARRIGGVTVHLRAEDLITARPGLRPQAAERLMDRHGGTLAAAMLGAGINAAIEIVRQEGGAS